MYYLRGMKARVSPVQLSKPHSTVLPPPPPFQWLYRKAQPKDSIIYIYIYTQDSNPGSRIQNPKRSPLHQFMSKHNKDDMVIA